MIPELGLFALILSLVAALVMSIMPMIGSYTRDISWMSVARPAALLHLLFLTLAYVALTVSGQGPSLNSVGICRCFWSRV